MEDEQIDEDREFTILETSRRSKSWRKTWDILQLSQTLHERDNTILLNWHSTTITPPAMHHHCIHQQTNGQSTWTAWWRGNGRGQPSTDHYPSINGGELTRGEWISNGGEHGVEMNEHGMEVNEHGMEAYEHRMKVNEHQIEVNEHHMEVNGHWMEVREHQKEVNGQRTEVNEYWMKMNGQWRWIDDKWSQMEDRRINVGNVGRRWTTVDEKEDEQIKEDDKFQLDGHRCVENQRWKTRDFPHHYQSLWWL